MGNEPDLHLAIRTITVSARVAIASSTKAGRPDVAAECARRGLLMLEALRKRIGDDTPEATSQQLNAAVWELTSAADASPGKGAAAALRDPAAAPAAEN